jgi:hypothetical protein
VGAHLHCCVKRTFHFPHEQPLSEAPGRPFVYLPSRLANFVFAKTPLAWEMALL